jgi:hypothetical protein
MARLLKNLLIVFSFKVIQMDWGVNIFRGPALASTEVYPVKRICTATTGSRAQMESD